ncbi:oxaloacetate decarboxylase subunit alpha [Helcococcus ovis]|uniref:Oxaloacetate decarboxylase subunit alpha n=2 Tax=Bacteria TaxID=2 RepID=A0A4R9C6A5_9FIRM|nr:oxaloacetate decarboxylase subunit alpha [Helcococcus ovis]TFF65341.1 oxaloacetate decarboxylase subunit alpha [Helcococcus ovis]TFF65985.1 oxaloacetate decarboxylase subunit alpha [Helcococcus ovis]TFF67702.1 oxaloacetate decarboxylase subunit alpha [Helcococcus ovis]WNZ01257.1 oxaloacetate decarboxylase subunit alpha [Helcococcus ovis]
MDKKNSVKVTETVLRDAHQSLMATRMPFSDMEPILPVLDQVGYASLECWGGATFDACIRYLNENPWERLRKIKKLVPNTPLQMLLRGQNLLGYRHYADDVVEKFIERAAINGIDIFRIFDALNDIRNLKKSMEVVQKYGKEAQIAIAYTTSPVHTIEYYVELSKEIQNMGADSICVKDMAGVLTPEEGYNLVKALKKEIKLPIVVHTHATSGLSQITLSKVVEAGADRVDTAISPLSEGTSQPATEAMMISFEESGYLTGLNKEKLGEVAEYFRKLRDKYIREGLIDPKMLMPDPRALIYQVPGGMLSNMYSQLKGLGLESKYEEVLAEVPKVRKDFGYPPLVTPLSQMVGTQATMNIVTGERYKMVSKEVKDYLKGKYGKFPVPVEESFRKSLVGEEDIISHRPADDLENEFTKLNNEIGELSKNDEDTLIYALFPEVGKNFLNNYYNPKPDIIKIKAYF